MESYLIRLGWYEPDNDALILAVSLHLGVAIVSDSEDVRRQFTDLALVVQFDLLTVVNR